MDRIIIGAGLSGLSAAHYLLKKDPHANFKILEASNRIGGWVKSTKLKNGVIFEQGPRTIRPRGAPGANTLQLIEELGLSDEVRPIVSSHPAAVNRMIYANEELHSLPSSITSLFVKQKPFTKPLIYYIAKELYTPSKKIARNDESLYDFIHRRLGKEVSDYLISPMICGICGGNAKEISVKFLMAPLFENEQKHGGILKGFLKSIWDGSYKIKPALEKSDLKNRALTEKWSIYSFADGLETLPKRMCDSIASHGKKVYFNEKCTEIVFKETEVLVKTDRETLHTQHLIASIPADKLSSIVLAQHPQLAQMLNSIETVSVCVVNLCYRGKLLEKDGFGFLVAPLENLPILGVIYDSCCFPCGENTVLTVMMGGHWFKQHFGDRPTEAQLLTVALKQVKNILKINDEPDECKVNVLYNCIPQYKVGHTDNVQKINDYIRDNKLRLSLCGASYNGVGVNDVILSAKNVVKNL